MIGQNIDQSGLLLTGDGGIAVNINIDQSSIAIVTHQSRDSSLTGGIRQLNGGEVLHAGVDIQIIVLVADNDDGLVVGQRKIRLGSAVGIVLEGSDLAVFGNSPLTAVAGNLLVILGLNSIQSVFVSRVLAVGEPADLIGVGSPTSNGGLAAHLLTGLLIIGLVHDDLVGGTIGEDGVGQSAGGRGHAAAAAEFSDVHIIAQDNRLIHCDDIAIGIQHQGSLAAHIVAGFLDVVGGGGVLVLGAAHGHIAAVLIALNSAVDNLSLVNALDLVTAVVVDGGHQDIVVGLQVGDIGEIVHIQGPAVQGDVGVILAGVSGQ
ncbi:Mu-like prophage tail protein gpP, partial [Dysosmobacter welbionis]